jgi:hypothetical protein
MKDAYMDVDLDAFHKLVDHKLKKRNKLGRDTTYFKWQMRQLDAELEHKLPNEFRGSIKHYNHRSCCGDFGQLDENQY